MTAASTDKQDSIQFRIKADEMEKHGEEILKMRRYDKIHVQLDSPQSKITDEGEVKFDSLNFQSTSTSISICILEDGLIATVTFSTEDPHVFEEIVKNHLRNTIVELTFTTGEKPE